MARLLGKRGDVRHPVVILHLACLKFHYNECLNSCCPTAGQAANSTCLQSSLAAPYLTHHGGSHTCTLHCCCRTNRKWQFFVRYWVACAGCLIVICPLVERARVLEKWSPL